MQKFHSLFLALGVAILIVPMAIFVKKFTAISDPMNFRVSFNPLECYECRECSCNFTLNDKETYKLNSYDKTVCKVDFNKINEGIKKRLDNITVEMTVPEYREFLDCAKWYSAHPSTVKHAN